MDDYEVGQDDDYNAVKPKPESDLTYYAGSDYNINFYNKPK